MLYALAQRGEAPALFTKTNTGGVPIWSVLAASSIGLLTVLANYFLPTEAVFNFLLNSSGAIAVVVYLCITVTQFRGRKRLQRENPGTLTVKMWAFPYLTIAVGIALLAVIAGMAFDSGSRQSLTLTLLVTGLTITAGVIHQHRGRGRRTPDAETPTPSPIAAHAEETT